MKTESIIPTNKITEKIFLIRNQKVMLDRDLAELYEVETKYLKRQIKRNLKRFPEDFMFEMTNKELRNWRSQFGTSNSSDKMGLSIPTYSRRMDNLVVASPSPLEKARVNMLHSFSDEVVRPFQ